MYRRTILAFLFTTACAASSSTIRTAHEAVYDAPFATVWNVVSEEVHKRYSALILIEDPVVGVIETNWKAIEQLDGDPAMRTAADPTGGSTGVGTTAVGQGGMLGVPAGVSLYNRDAALLRVSVRVKGPPWSVVVDGQAAQYKPGFKLIPYQRRAIDEPTWVQGRIDALAVDIYERLAQYAAKAKPVADKVAKPAESFWNQLDPAAAETVAAVHKAAAARDAAALRPSMIDNFRWAAGADGSADTALALWAADPAQFTLIAQTLRSSCATAATGDVVCAAEHGQARFRSVGGAWKFIEFTSR